MLRFDRCQELNSCLNKILFFQDLCLGAVEAAREGVLPNSIESVNNISLTQRQYHKLLSVDTVLTIYFPARFIVPLQLAVK